MAIDKVKEYFRQFGMEEKVLEFDVSSATVDLAAEAVGVEGARICKTMSFLKPEGAGAILVQMAGDGRINNRKFKDQFGFKAKMLKPDEVLASSARTRFSSSRPSIWGILISLTTKSIVGDCWMRSNASTPFCATSTVK